MTCKIKYVDGKKTIKMFESKRGHFYIVHKSNGELPDNADVFLRTVEGYENLTSGSYSNTISHCKNHEIYEVDVELSILRETQQ